VEKGVTLMPLPGCTSLVGGTVLCSCLGTHSMYAGAGVPTPTAVAL